MTATELGDRQAQRATTGLSASVEADVAVGKPVRPVARVVDPVVMVAAEQLALVEVGAAAPAPRVSAVVGLAPGTGHVTALGAAGLVADQQGLALCRAEQAA